MQVEGRKRQEDERKTNDAAAKAEQARVAAEQKRLAKEEERDAARKKKEADANNKKIGTYSGEYVYIERHNLQLILGLNCVYILTGAGAYGDVGKACMGRKDYTAAGN